MLHSVETVIQRTLWRTSPVDVASPGRERGQCGHSYGSPLSACCHATSTPPPLQTALGWLEGSGGGVCVCVCVCVCWMLLSNQIFDLK